ncbi:MAG: hypothetical protein CML68_18405 [Rhodobacteraceae bacterium]|nr:hypothetical protein [Paracoccaceae bacterium]
MPRLALLAALVLAGPAVAQDGLGHALEIGSHVRLMSVMAENEPSPFVTDGCSGGLSVGWSFAAEAFPGFADLHGNRPPWEECCITHDRAYHDPDALDAEASFTARRAADVTLRACVVASAQERSEELQAAYGLTPEGVVQVYKGIADTMFNAVRLGGGPCTLLPWRWGYGYPLCPLVE